GRDLRLERRREAARERHLPLHGVDAGRGLGQAEERGAQPVRERGRRSDQPGRERDKRRGTRAGQFRGSGGAAAALGAAIPASASARTVSPRSLGLKKTWSNVTSSGVSKRAGESS